jgi:serine protease Do
MVAHVERGGPAEKAGILVGDVIVQIDSKRVESIDDLHRHLTAGIVGKETHLIILRLEKKISLTLVPGELVAS